MGCDEGEDLRVYIVREYQRKDEGTSADRRMMTRTCATPSTGPVTVMTRSSAPGTASVTSTRTLISSSSSRIRSRAFSKRMS